MRLHLSSFILMACMATMTFSCSKSSQDEMVLESPRVSGEVISATVATGAAYELPLAKYGTVSVSTQAVNFSESRAGIDPKSGLLVYRYVSAPGFTGNDEVVLKSTKTVRSYQGNSCNMGGGSSYDKVVSSYITVRLKVTQ